MPLTFGAYSGAAAMICAEIVGRAWLYSYVRLFDCSLNALLFFTALQSEQLFSSMICREQTTLAALAIRIPAFSCHNFGMRMIID